MVSKTYFMPCKSLNVEAMVNYLLITVYVHILKSQI